MIVNALNMSVEETALVGGIYKDDYAGDEMFGSKAQYFDRRDNL